MSSRYFFTAAMDIAESKEEEFNDIYEKEHIPYLTDVPGVISIARFTTQPLKMILGGEEKEIVIEGQPKHTAVYEIEHPEVLLSDGWAQSVDKGRWSTNIRPHTFNRRHVLFKKTSI